MRARLRPHLRDLLDSLWFTPRVMRNLTGDTGTQVVLGVFFGTFTCALIVLRAVRSSTLPS